MEDILAKKRERAERATEAYAHGLVKERTRAQKQRNGRLIKLGVAIEQMLLRGDGSLLARIKAAIVGTDGHKAIAARAVDRADFALDEPVTWFDEIEQKALEHRAGGAREVPLGARAGADPGSAAPKKEGAAAGAAPGAPGARPAAPSNGAPAAQGAAASAARAS